MTTRGAAPNLDRRIELPGERTQTGTDRFGHPEFEIGPARPIWAARRDPSAARTLEVSETSTVSITAAVFTVNFHDGIGLAAGVEFTDDRGATRRIVSEPVETYGRGLFLEFIAELIT